MRAVVGSIVAAVAASACCLGPVVLALVGLGGFGATLASLEVYRPYLVGVSMALLGAAFWLTYRPAESTCGPEGCRRSARCGARVVLWVVTVVVALTIAFPYYVSYLF